MKPLLPAALVCVSAECARVYVFVCLCLCVCVCVCVRVEKDTLTRCAEDCTRSVGHEYFSRPAQSMGNFKLNSLLPMNL